MVAPKLSIVIPIHESMPNGEFFLWRLMQSIMKQSFRDYEVVVVQEGKMAENTNIGIKKSRGELIKILYLDDYLAHRHALQNIVDAFDEDEQWLVTGCLHQRIEDQSPHSPHLPEWTPDIVKGNNRIGSPSVLTVRNKGHLLFDENLSFYLDCDLYTRYYQKYGSPYFLEDLGVVIGIHNGQTSMVMPEREKLQEYEYMQHKYA